MGTMKSVSQTTSKMIKPNKLNKWAKNNMNGYFLTKSSYLLSYFMSNNAIALVDDRLAGEGTGKILGINDPILGWIIIGSFTTVWALYYTANRELGGQDEKDGL